MLLQDPDQWNVYLRFNDCSSCKSEALSKCTNQYENSPELDEPCAVVWLTGQEVGRHQEPRGAEKLQPKQQVLFNMCMQTDRVQPFLQSKYLLGHTEATVRSPIDDSNDNGQCFPLSATCYKTLQLPPRFNTVSKVTRLKVGR